MRNLGLALGMAGTGAFSGCLWAKIEGKSVFDPTLIIIVSFVIAVAGIVLGITGMRGEKL